MQKDYYKMAMWSKLLLLVDDDDILQSCKLLSKLFSLTILVDQVSWLNDFVIQKMYSRMYPTL